MKHIEKLRFSHDCCVDSNEEHDATVESFVSEITNF
jgi:hypothetical protein